MQIGNSVMSLEIQESEKYDNAFALGLKPDPILTVSEWADKYRKLSQKASAEAGQWRTSRTPYLREIMDEMSPSSKTEEIVFAKGSQVGGTETLNNLVGFTIMTGGPIMLVQPTVDAAKKNSKQRIAPLIEESPELKALVKDAKSRDSGNTVLIKEFPGGVLVMTGANSATGLKSTPIKILCLDEIDEYPHDLDQQGSALDLATARTRTFSKRKIIYVSTPTVDGRSAIQNLYDGSDQRKYFVPCPHCQHMQHLYWGQVKFDFKDPESATYECESCNEQIENWQKTTMLLNGEWRATNLEKVHPKKRGYHLSSLYSPVGWASWGDLAKLWVDAQGNNEKLKAFVNTVLGETWKDRGDAPDWKRLWERRETYKTNTVQPGVLKVVAGVDVQGDRIEMEILGFGRDMESWSIDYRVFYGDTSTIESPVWGQLEKVIHESWTAPNGIEMPLSMVCVDSGFNTQVVYNFCRKFPIQRVRAVKGSHTASIMVGLPSQVDLTVGGGRKIKNGMRVFSVGVAIAKQELYGWLKQPKPGPDESTPYGFCHFPEYDEEFFKMLTAEELVIRWVKAVKKYEWEKVRDRNEALDCRIYCRIAGAMLGLDRYTEKNWTKLESEFGQVSVQKTAENVQKPAEKQKKTAIKRRKSTFL